ncbi:MAG: hypothetical protein IKC69_00830, partial [Clostridia bacterium]|nr:hypothetical protein [Clostridia bacterium]
MKQILKKSFSTLLALVLLLPCVMGLFVQAAVTPLEGQKTVPVVKVKTPTVPDGTISKGEYGIDLPTLRLSTENGLWAEDLEGNPVTEGLPEYVDLYLAQDDERLYVALSVREDAHESEEYLLDAFFGFGDDTNSHTMNSGKTTSYKMTKKYRAKFLREWMDTVVTSLESKTVSEDGTETETTPLHNELLTYPLLQWGNVKTDETLQQSFTTYEFELEFADTLTASGKDGAKLPDYGYFAFDLALYTGKDRTGTLHFSVGLGGEGEAESAPHVLDLTGTAIDPLERSADLSALILEGAELTPAFDPDVTEYDAQLSFDLPAAVTAVAKGAESGAVVQVFGEDTVGTAGTGTIRILVTAKSGYQK